MAAASAALRSYPMAYARRARALVEGAAARSMRNPIRGAENALLHATAVRPPVRRAVFHFIGQTLMRLPRYRIYLVLYGGVGLSVVAATVLRFSINGTHLQADVSSDGIRATIGVVAFWVIAGCGRRSCLRAMATETGRSALCMGATQLRCRPGTVGGSKDVGLSLRARGYARSVRPAPLTRGSCTSECERPSHNCWSPGACAYCLLTRSF